MSRKKEIDKAMIIIAADPTISLHFLTKPSIQTAFSIIEPKYDLPKSRHGLRSLLAKAHLKLKSNLTQILSTLEFRPTITADIWTANIHSYLGIN